MDFNDFGENEENSAYFLIEKLKELHPWDEEWSFDVSIKLVPFYKEQLEMMKISLEMKDSHLKIDDFNNLIRFFYMFNVDVLSYILFI